MLQVIITLLLLFSLQAQEGSESLVKNILKSLENKEADISKKESSPPKKTTAFSSSFEEALKLYWDEQKKLLPSEQKKQEKWSQDLTKAAEIIVFLEKNRKSIEEKRFELYKKRQETQQRLSEHRKTILQKYKKIASLKRKIQERKDLLAKQKKLKQKVKLLKSLGWKRTSYSGKITAIEKSLGLIQISPGEKAGLNRGKILQVMRDETIVGSVWVKSCYPDSGIVILEKGDVQVGDQVQWQWKK